jgi:hypothetical protein
MKNRLIGFLSLLILLLPGVSFAATTTLGGLIHIPAPELPVFPSNRLTCSVEATISRPNSINNKVTYKVHYDSNYSLMNGQYTVYGNLPRLPANLPVYQAAGAASFNKGSGYITIQGNVENSFTYPIKDNASITLRASLAGVQCTSKVLNTIPAPVLSAQPSINLSDLSINTSSLGVTTSIHLDAPVQAQAADVILPAEQLHTCKMLVEAAAIDSDSILIGGAISFNNIKVGSYPYTVRGYRSDSPNNVTKYSGVYNAKLDTATGLAFGQDGKAFLFTYDSKVSTDSYIITATLGNIDCSAVIFPSHLASVSVLPKDPDTATSSPVQVDNSTDVNGVVAVGLTEEERQQAENIGLLSKSGDVQAQAAVQEKIEKETGLLPATGALESKDADAWTSRDYTIAGLLGAIFVALISYIVMKYRGMM